MPDPDEIITVTRVLKYRGPRKWVEATLKASTVRDGHPWVFVGGRTISSEIVATVAELPAKELEGK